MSPNIEKEQSKDFAATPQSQSTSKKPLKLWVQWVIIIVSGIALWTVLSQVQLPSVLENWPLLTSAVSWVVAAGVVISQGIELFSGSIPDLGWQSNYTAILVAILIPLLIAPTLLLLNFRRLILETVDDSWLPKRLKVVAGFIIGGALCVPLFAFSPYIAYVQVKVYQSMHQSLPIRTNKDALLSDLDDLAFQAQAFYFLPRDLGGGGRTWRNMPASEGTTRDFGLRDLHYTQPVLANILADIMPQSPNRFVVEPITNDTTLIIVGVGNEMGSDPNFVNKDGNKGRLQIRKTITPHSTDIKYDNDSP